MVKNKSDKAIIIGSAPVSENLRTYDLSGFVKIAINQSWKLREDFDVHVGLNFMKERHTPPPEYKAIKIKRAVYNRSLVAAGGQYMCSPSVSLIAGYWAILNSNCNTISYYGCDLVFDKDRYGGRTHFYGVSDKGPLFNKHPCMKRQDLKSTRLFCWGLMHRTLLINSSAEEGSLLTFPVAPLDVDHASFFNEVFSSKHTSEILKAAANVFEFERTNRTPAFDGGWLDFKHDKFAVSMLNAMLDRWEIVKDLCVELNDKFASKSASYS